MLGGNASSEVRVPVCGAGWTYNNRWAREGGVVDEILVENRFRNPEGNAVLFDTVLLDMVTAEPGISLLLDTVAVDVQGRGAAIRSVRAFCSMSQTIYDVEAPLFCDASGDGVLAYLSGAAFRMGAEAREEFGEDFAPSEEFGTLLGHTIPFYIKDGGRRVSFNPPGYALEEISRIPRHRRMFTQVRSEMTFLSEYGGRLDTVRQAGQIKWELWRIVFGIWNHLKNSGSFTGVENLTLEWVGAIPGKRESRRFEGYYMLTQRDIVEQTEHDDAVAYGGFAVDLHPADGVFADDDGDEIISGAHLLVPRGIYQIPYRCLISKDVPNLFLAGRLASSSHVAFGSTRVMATCAQMGQAVGMAAAVCTATGATPRALLEPARMVRLQRELLKSGQFIPGVALQDDDDLVQKSEISASSELVLTGLPANGAQLRLDRSRAQLLPLPAGELPSVTFVVDVEKPTTLRAEVRTGRGTSDYTPDVVLGVVEVPLLPGVKQKVDVAVEGKLDEARYVFYCLLENEHVAVHTSDQLVSGLTSVFYEGKQGAAAKRGAPDVEYWWPGLREPRRNLAFSVDRPLRPGAAENVRNGYSRPTTGVNAWVAAKGDLAPKLLLSWGEAKTIAEIDISFDTDFDDVMQSVLRVHDDRSVLSCVRHYRIWADGELAVECLDNHQTINKHVFENPLKARRLTLDIVASHGDVPAAVFEFRCYESPQAVAG